MEGDRNVVLPTSPSTKPVSRNRIQLGVGVCGHCWKEGNWFVFVGVILLGPVDWVGHDLFDPRLVRYQPFFSFHSFLHCGQALYSKNRVYWCSSIDVLWLSSC